jgi:hypothetical protein
MLSKNISMDDKGNTHLMLPILKDGEISYTSYFGFYTTDGYSFILAVVFLGPQSPVIWSAKP